MIQQNKFHIKLNIVNESLNGVLISKKAFSGIYAVVSESELRLKIFLLFKKDSA